MRTVLNMCVFNVRNATNEQKMACIKSLLIRGMRVHRSEEKTQIRESIALNSQCNGVELNL